MSVREDFFCEIDEAGTAVAAHPGVDETGESQREADEEAVVSEEGVRRIVREWRRWLWGAYRAMNLSLEDVAAEIGATRQGFSKLLRFADRRFLFDTFVRGCFLRREAETGFASVAGEGQERMALK